MNTFFGLLIASLCGLTNALYIPVRVNHDAQASSRGTGVHNPAIRLVGSFRQQSDDANNGSVVNFQDTVYATNMTIGGQDVLIQLDTGSSDLWVNLDEGEIEFSNTTDLPAQEAYGIGQIAGTIQFANVELGDNMVPNQAFMNVSNATNFSTIFNDGVRGILGLAFDAGSTIESTITEAYGEDSELGESFLTNVFQQDTSKPLFTVQLGRAGDPQYTTEGAFTIGEYLPDYETIEDMPKLERFPNNGTGAAPRWSTVMSGMTVNGEPFQFNTSGVPGTPEGSVVAVLDTGFTFPPIPKPAVDAIYGGIDGAYYDTNSSLWIVPCNKATTLEFQFGELSVPIHPLDLTTIVQINNTQVCVNTFRPSTFPVNTQFDLVLGDAFLKNVYASFNYGNMSEDAVPYMQLLPTTDMHAASKEFDSVRSAMYAQAAASAAASSASASAASAYAALVSGSASTACSTAMPTATPLFASAWSSSAPSAVMTDSTPAITASPDLSGLGNGNSSNPTAASSADGSSATDASSTDPAATDASSTDGSSTTAISDTSTPTSTGDSSASTTSDTSTSSPTDSATSSTATSTDSSTDPSATSTASAADPNATSTDSSSDNAGTASTASAADPSATSSGDSSSGGDSSSTGSLPIDGSSSSDDGSGSLQENTSLLDSSGGSKQSTFGNSLYGDGGNGYARAFRRSYREPTKTVHDCLTPMIEEYGALLFALIAGTFIISFALCLVTVVLAIRNHSRSQARKRAEYFVLEANAEAEADPEAACTATYHYSDDY